MNDPRLVQKWQAGGSGMVSTLEDYAHFAQMLVNGGTLAGRRYLAKRRLPCWCNEISGPDPV